MNAPVIKRLAIKSMPSDTYRCLQHLTFGRGGLMEEWLYDMVHRRVRGKIYVAMHPTTMKIIAWGCLYYGECKPMGDDAFPSIGVFVDPVYRKQGIGTMLVNALMRHEKSFYYDDNAAMSTGFYGTFNLPSQLAVNHRNIFLSPMG